jgi:hypothetical protein
MSKNIGIQIESGTYEVVIKIKKDSNAMITQGIIVDDVLNQNQALILLFHKGEIKDNPLFGVGIEDIINDNELTSWKKDIMDMMSKDGMKVNKIDINNSNINIDAKYE